MKPLLTALTALLVLSTAIPADAMRRGDNAVPEQRLKLKKEWAAARAAGGYSDPISGLISLLRGEETDRLIQPVINDPKPDTIFDNFKDGGWERATE